MSTKFQLSIQPTNQPNKNAYMHTYTYIHTYIQAHAYSSIEEGCVVVLLCCVVFYCDGLDWIGLVGTQQVWTVYFYLYVWVVIFLRPCKPKPITKERIGESNMYQGTKKHKVKWSGVEWSRRVFVLEHWLRSPTTIR